METIISLWWLWATLMVGGFGVAVFFQLKNIKRVKSFDIDNLNYVGPIVGSLIATIGSVLMLMTLIGIVINYAKS